MNILRTCDGIERREFLRLGTAGGVGLTLAGWLNLRARGAVDEGARARSAIFVNLGGGPSHLDTFDMKPGAPSEYRGTFDPIDTNVPGVRICEHLPKLAQCADKFAILRGVSHTLAAHELGSQYVNTGSRPIASLEYPGYGCVVTKETEKVNPTDLPPFVAVPNAGRQRPGFLGVRYAALNTAAVPRPGQPFNVRGISLSGGLTVDAFESRQSLLRDLDAEFDSVQTELQLLDGLDRFAQQAASIITSPRARQAFDIGKESPDFAKPFGEQPFGMSCLLATRLIESGVRFVTIELNGWDTHQNNFARLKDNLLPQLDTGLSSLLNGLQQKGLLSSTAVFVTGEFGRTPKINQRSPEGGRDHYPRCMFMLMAGGSVRGGQAIGLSDDRATAPADKGFSPDDAAASFYHNLGIDHTREYQTNTGRPVTIVRDGTVISQLFG